MISTLIIIHVTVSINIVSDDIIVAFIIHDPNNKQFKFIIMIIIVPVAIIVPNLNCFFYFNFFKHNYLP